ncbi:MAG: hypothetical protein IPM52_01055 [Bacteroidetes bacterium]|nr:hypothetical protein [Bacteroidota bacterium]
MELRVEPVRSAGDLRIFIHLTEQLHKNHPQWVPPIYKDEYRYFSPGFNPALRDNHTILALAWMHNKPVGRVMGIINQRYNQSHNEAHVRFCFLDCPDDQNICNALLNFVAQWGATHGMSHLVGPLGFSDKDPQGMMVEGFDEKPVIATNLNQVYLPDLLQNYGFAKHLDLVSYLIPTPESLPERYLNAIQRVQQSDAFILKEFKGKRELRRWIMPVFRLINEAYRDIYGFDPLSEEEMKELAHRYLPVLDAEFVKLITDRRGRLLAFVVAMPELSEGIRKAGGRIWPFGWWHILKCWRSTQLLTLLLGAVHPDHRNHGLTLLLAQSLIQTARQRGITHIDSHLILEHNRLMRAECERLGGRLHKRFRIFIKPLATT